MNAKKREWSYQYCTYRGFTAPHPSISEIVLGFLVRSSEMLTLHASIPAEDGMQDGSNRKNYEHIPRSLRFA
jgi:hypothetical protein